MERLHLGIARAFAREEAVDLDLDTRDDSQQLVSRRFDAGVEHAVAREGASCTHEHLDRRRRAFSPVDRVESLVEQDECAEDALGRADLAAIWGVQAKQRDRGVACGAKGVRR